MRALSHLLFPSSLLEEYPLYLSRYVLLYLSIRCFHYIADLLRDNSQAWGTIADRLFIVQAYQLLSLVAPRPRAVRTSEKQYITVDESGKKTTPKPLPCWYDEHIARKEEAVKGGISAEEAYEIQEAEVLVSVIVPAYNEEKRLGGMLEETVDFLAKAYSGKKGKGKANGAVKGGGSDKSGWEILIVDDGSRDKTVDTALAFVREHRKGIPLGSVRIISLEENRGKGGAVTHGMRHVRGEYVVFADADGASRISDLASLVEGCEKVKDVKSRAVGIGSRAHLVGSEAVVKV